MKHTAPSSIALTFSFRCCECLRPFEGDSYYVSDDQKVYCEDDYYRLFGDRCARCGDLIKESVVTAMDKKWYVLKLRLDGSWRFFLRDVHQGTPTIFRVISAGSSWRDSRMSVWKTDPCARNATTASNIQVRHLYIFLICLSIALWISPTHFRPFTRLHLQRLSKMP